jgi:hypothetical protein
MQCEHDKREYRYNAVHHNEVKEGKVRLFCKEERDALLHEAGLAHVVSEDTAEDIGCTYVFDPPIEIGPGMSINIGE